MQCIACTLIINIIFFQYQLRIPPLSFYYRLPVVERCFEKCLYTWITCLNSINIRTEIWRQSLVSYIIGLFRNVTENDNLLWQTKSGTVQKESKRTWYLPLLQQIKTMKIIKHGSNVLTIPLLRRTEPTIYSKILYNVKGKY